MEKMRTVLFSIVILLLLFFAVSCGVDDDAYTARSGLVGAWLGEYDSERYVFKDDGTYVGLNDSVGEWSATTTQLKIEESGSLSSGGEYTGEYIFTYGITGNKLLLECYLRTKGSGSDGSWRRVISYKEDVYGKDGEKIDYLHSYVTQTVTIDGDNFTLFASGEGQEFGNDLVASEYSESGNITWSDDAFIVTDVPLGPNDPVVTPDQTTKTIRGCYWKKKDILVLNTGKDCDEYSLEKE